LNKVIANGNLVRDPEVKQAGNTKTARFSIACKRNFKDKDGNYGADFVNCVAFGKTAEFVEKYFHKGSPIIVEGRINTGSYTNKDGQKVYTTDVAVEKVEFNGKAEAAKNENPDGFLNLPDNASDELPVFG